MPNRLLKEGIVDSGKIDSLSVHAEVFFYRLLVVADDYGRMDGRPAILRARCFPLKEMIGSDEIYKWLSELDESGLAFLYSVDGSPYLQILNWDQRQRSHGKYPAPDELSATCAQSADNLPQSAADGGLGLGLGKGSGKGLGETNTAEYSAEFEVAWEIYPSRPGANKRKAYKAWLARLKAGATHEAITEGVKRYAAYVVACKTEPQFVKQPQTFFGPDDHFLLDWSVPQTRTPQKKFDPMDAVLPKQNGGENGRIIEH